MSGRARFLLLVLVALPACGRVELGPASPAGRLRYAELPLARAAGHQGLKEELSLVEAAGGLPQQLAAIERSPRKGESPAAALRQIFPPISRSMTQGQLDDIYSGGALTLSPLDLERARELLQKQASACEKFRRTLPTTETAFGVPIGDGILADLDFLDPLAIGCRLEAVAAAVCLAENRPDDALPHLATMLRAARALAVEWNIATRLAAANLRSDALAVLAAIAAHPQSTRSTQEQLFDTLAAETADWPDDAQAWLGDRAAGLLVYELVRDGQYLSLLSVEEVKRLEDERLVRITAQAVMRGIDEDQLFYLRAMRQLIDVCPQPHYERQAVLDAIRADLVAREDRADYPLVAGRLLLADFETAHRRQAEDFALCQGWLLALGTALGRNMAAPPMNPLTGQPYEVERLPLAVQVNDCQVPIVR